MLGTIAQRLREVTVRPTAGVGERQRWDELMGAHHYLPFRTLVGRSVRHVAVLGERWLALVGWQAGDQIHRNTQSSYLARSYSNS